MINSFTGYDGTSYGVKDRIKYNEDGFEQLRDDGSTIATWVFRKGTLFGYFASQNKANKDVDLRGKYQFSDSSTIYRILLNSAEKAVVRVDSLTLNDEGYFVGMASADNMKTVVNEYTHHWSKDNTLLEDRSEYKLFKKQFSDFDDHGNPTTIRVLQGFEEEIVQGLRLQKVEYIYCSAGVAG